MLISHHDMSSPKVAGANGGARSFNFCLWLARTRARRNEHHRGQARECRAAQPASIDRLVEHVHWSLVKTVSSIADPHHSSPVDGRLEIFASKMHTATKVHLPIN